VTARPKRGAAANSAAAPAGAGTKRPVNPQLGARYDTRRQELVDIAARLYAANGYHATSVDDLVEASGLQRGGLYHYIEGKQDLLVAIHDRFIEPLLERARPVGEADDPPNKKLVLLARALMYVISTYQDHVTVFLNDWRAIKEGPEWQRIHDARREFESIVESVLEAGRTEGLFAIRDTRVATRAFLGMVNYTYQWYVPGGPLAPEALADELSSFFLTGVLTEQGARREAAAHTQNA
jgi:TetR/AcrR family transcriptional regulator, cholesterol catabolism regulator